MTESEKFLFVVPCGGVSNNVEPPVSVSVGYNIDRVYLSIGCPFAKETEEYGRKVIKCTAPTPEAMVTRSKVKMLKECYHLNRKINT